MAGAGRDVVGPLVLGAWDAFLDVVRSADLTRATRLPGWRAHDVCVHLGVWDDYAALAGLLASARAGGTGGAPDVDAANAAVVAAHRDASREDVLAALVRHRDAVRRYLDGEPAALDLAPTASPVGRLPLLSVVLAEAYELAVHALDLRAAGAGEPDPALLSAGLAGLAEVTGALAATTGVDGGATLQAPSGGWTFRARNGEWDVTATGPGVGVWAAPADLPEVRGEADVLLDASAGRANPVALLARRRLAVRDLSGMLRLAPIVDAAPNLPGGPILSLAARSVGGAAGVLSRFRR